MVEMKIVEIVSKCNAVFDNERICLRAEFDETSFLIKRTDVSGFSEVVEVPLASNSLVDCTINIWSMQLSNMVKNMIDGAITTILETPESTLYPEKKYRLALLPDDSGYKNYLCINNGLWGFSTQKYNDSIFTESDIEELKKCYPEKVDLIDAMKEPVENE